MQPDAELALSTLRVVDLLDRLTGAYCTKLLVDSGATVVKVEPPAGDLRWRRSTVPRSTAPPGALFHYLCAAKQSIVFDLDIAQRTNKVRQLVRSADLVVERWLPGEAERRGLSLPERQC